MDRTGSSRRTFMAGAAAAGDRGRRHRRRGAVPAAAAAATGAGRRWPRAAQSVAVLGGGVAGLTAAHELAERGFTRHRLRAPGARRQGPQHGRARQRPRRPPAAARRARLPLHPRASTTTCPTRCGASPSPGTPNGVWDNLVAPPEMMFARAGGREDLRAPVPWPGHPPAELTPRRDPPRPDRHPADAWSGSRCTRRRTSSTACSSSSPAATSGATRSGSAPPGGSSSGPSGCQLRLPAHPRRRPHPQHRGHQGRGGLHPYGRHPPARPSSSTRSGAARTARSTGSSTCRPTRRGSTPGRPICAPWAWSSGSAGRYGRCGTADGRVSGVVIEDPAGRRADRHRRPLRLRAARRARPPDLGRRRCGPPTRCWGAATSWRRTG